MVMSEKIAEVQDIKPINVVTWKDKLEAYKKRPLSLFLLIAVTLSAGITVAVLGALIIYILANGIMNLTPELFAWKYTTENVSMLPAIINTVLMTALSLLIAVPIGICSAIYLVEYAKRGNKLVNVVRITTETLSGIPSIVYGLFGYRRCIDTFHHGTSNDHAYNRRSASECAGFLPGRKLRSWCWQTSYNLQSCIAIGSTGNLVRRDLSNRSYRW